MENLHKPTLRVIQILELLKKHQEGLNITDISKLTGISVGTLHPILKTLNKLNYLNYEDKTYTIDFLANSKLEQEKQIKIISFYMDKLSKKINKCVQLGMLSADKVVYIYKSESDDKISLKTKAGDVAYAYSTALGKALLLDTSKEEMQNIFKNDFILNTKNTLKNIDELYLNLQKFKQLKYTYEIAEFHDDFVCFAVPIYKNEKIIAAISVTILIFHHTKELEKYISDSLLEYKALIEENI